MSVSKFYYDETVESSEKEVGEKGTGKAIAFPSRAFSLTDITEMMKGMTAAYKY